MCVRRVGVHEHCSKSEDADDDDDDEVGVACGTSTKLLPIFFFVQHFFLFVSQSEKKTGRANG